MKRRHFDVAYRLIQVEAAVADWFMLPAQDRTKERLLKMLRDAMFVD